jgi:hypothetical protein
MERHIGNYAVPFPNVRNWPRVILPGWMLNYMVSNPETVASTSTLADAPIKDINSFIGTFTLNTPPATMDDASRSTESVPMHPLPPSVSPLTIENVLWANTVLAAG